MFNDRLLLDFMKSFYGYGNYSGKYWFIGLEEGGGNSFEEINKRLSTWDNRGQCELEDVAGYHNDIGITHLFRKKPKVQYTWRGLMKILLSAEGETLTPEKFREYQRDSLGRPEGMDCLVELMPLPSPSTHHWLYADYSRLPSLESRDAYFDTYSSFRKTHLRKRVQEHKPNAVVFYSSNKRYRSFWEDISCVRFEPARDIDVHFGRNNHTVFVITKHPAARGIGEGYFETIGGMISDGMKA